MNAQLGFGPQTIATILKHDSKVTSYKIALIRAINDVVLAFPDLTGGGTSFNAPPEYQTESQSAASGAGLRDVAIPLRMLAQFWVAYYWPFVDPEEPIYQGPRSFRDGQLRNDIDFRPELTDVRRFWEEYLGCKSLPSDGFFVQTELGNPRREVSYSPELRQAHQEAVQAISKTIQMPIRYAGPGNWGVFDRPRTWAKISLGAGTGVTCVPGTRPDDQCLVISASLWEAFRVQSLWIEALSIHEWCLFTERLAKGQNEEERQHPMEDNRRPAFPDRGDIYRLLTARPGNRRPLTWERNQVEILLLEGARFACPWTRKTITSTSQFDIHHLLPLSVYPVNDLWNLVPADPKFNQHIKRDRIPSRQKLNAAIPLLADAYANYGRSKLLDHAVKQDATLRFANLPSGNEFPVALAHRAVNFIEEVAQARNVARF